MAEAVSRRRFFRRIGGGAFALALPEFSLDCKVLTFHWADNITLANNIRAMESEARKNILACDLVEALHEARPLPLSYVLTADDGYAHQMGYLDVLARLGKQMTFFIMGDWRGNGRFSYITYPQVREISNAGHEIGCHTRDHPSDLTIMRTRNPGDFGLQTKTAKEFLENVTGKGVRTFAYPYGNYDLPTAMELANLYEGAFTTNVGNIHILKNALTLPRIGIV